MAITINPAEASRLFVYSGDPAVQIAEDKAESHGITPEAGALVPVTDCEKTQGATKFRLRPLSASQVIEIERLTEEKNTAAAIATCIEHGLVNIDDNDPPQKLAFYIETAVHAAVLALSLGQFSGN